MHDSVFCACFDVDLRLADVQAQEFFGTKWAKFEHSNCDDVCLNSF